MNVADAYRTRRFDREQARKIVPPRRGAIPSFPGLSILQQTIVAKQLFEQFGLEEYVGCVTSEMRRRPLMHAFHRSRTAQLRPIIERWMPAVVDFFLERMTPGTVTFNKTSRTGYPYFTTTVNKKEIALATYARLVRGDTSSLDHAFATANVRLQTEKPSRVREFNFLSPEGVAYSAEVSGADRQVKVKSRSASGPVTLELFGSRTRDVALYPPENNVLQVVDTLYHHAQLSCSSFKFNMYGPGGMPPMRSHVLAIDVSHFERFLPEADRIRAACIGGVYATTAQLLDRLPFLVPADNWQDYFLVSVNEAAGWLMQYASGRSSVAPVAKDVMSCVLSEYGKVRFKLSDSEAIKFATGSGNDKLLICDYGDDQVYSSNDKGELAAIRDFIGSFFDIKDEVPPKFLGFIYQPDGQWKLGVASYLLKNYLAERKPGSNFRPWPNLGLLLKRDNYARYGVAKLREEVFPAEERALKAVGLDWGIVVARGRAEEQEMLKISKEAIEVVKDANFLLGKEYLLSEEQLAHVPTVTGEKMYATLAPSEAAAMVRTLVSRRTERVIGRDARRNSVSGRITEFK